MVIAIIQFICMTFMPESKVWLLLRYGESSNLLEQTMSSSEGRRSESLSVTGEVDERYRDYGQKINFALRAQFEVDRDEFESSGFTDPLADSSALNVSDDFRNSLSSVKSDKQQHEDEDEDEDKEELHIDERQHAKFYGIMKPPPGISPTYYYQSIIIILYLAVAQQFCGHVNILNFAPDIFAQAMGYDDAEEEGNYAQSLIPMLFLGSIKFIVTAWVVWELDTGIGRRSLYILGVSFICFGLFLLICAFAGETDFSRMTTAQEVTTVLGVASIVIGYAASFGPLTWLVTSELFPASVRGRALGYSEVVTMTAAWLVSYTYLSGQDLLGPAIPFTFYFICTMFTLLFIIIAVPDTGSASTGIDDSDLGVMEYEMSQMWLWSNEKSFTLPSATELSASDVNYNCRKAELV